MEVVFINNFGAELPNHILITNNFCKYIGSVLELPQSITIEFSELGDNEYGYTMLEHRFKNRVLINGNIDLKMLLKVLVHEFIHINQIHTKRLQIKNNKTMVWENRMYNVESPKTMNYLDYSKLPWEIDVKNKEETVLFLVLEEFDKNNKICHNKGYESKTEHNRILV